MCEVKTFKIKGEIRKRNMKAPFQKEIRAVKAQDALDKVYMEIGSKHKAKRFEIKIIEVEEVKPEKS
jgi:large subunit ribosomal protein LX